MSNKYSEQYVTSSCVRQARHDLDSNRFKSTKYSNPVPGTVRKRNSPVLVKRAPRHRTQSHTSTTTTMADDSFALNVSPESELTFSLSRSSSGVDATPRCTLKLTHPGNSLDYLAFKVRDPTLALRYDVLRGVGCSTNATT